MGDLAAKIEAIHQRAVKAFFAGDFAGAASLFEEVVKDDPGHVVGHLNLAACALKLRLPEDALVHADRALALDPGLARAHTYRGVALTELLRHGEALPAVLQGFQAAPDDALTLVNVARVYAELNQFAEAVRWYSNALALDPENVSAHFGRAVVQLQLGDYEAGFAAYEWRWRERGYAGSSPRYPQPRWIGQFGIEGKTILLHEEQGIGDTIQFARYALWLTDRFGARVVLYVRPELRELFRCFEPKVKVIGEGDPMPHFDCHTQLLSLPLACGTRVDAVPAARRYLAAPQERVALWLDRLGPRRGQRVGIVWSGSQVHHNDRARSISLAEFPVPDAAKFDVVSLQHEVRETDQALLDSLPVAKVGGQFRDLADTAAVIELMDLVITVDTSVAHLAAALGKPVWLLLPFNADWRWLPGREDTPWYPTVRIFWQRRVGDWSDVADRVRQALAA